MASALFLPLALYQQNNFAMFPIKVALLSPNNPHPEVRRLGTLAFQRLLGPSRTVGSLAKWAKAYPIPQRSDLPPEAFLLAPLGYPSTLLPATESAITNGRYRGLGNVMAPYEVTEKIAEVANHPRELLLFMPDARCAATVAGPESGPAGPELAAADHAARRELLLNLQPFYLPHVRHQEALYAPLCAYISSHYQVTNYRGPFAGSEIWERIPEQSPIRSGQ